MTSRADTITPSRNPVIQNTARADRAQSSLYYFAVSLHCLRQNAFLLWAGQLHSMLSTCTSAWGANHRHAPPHTTLSILYFTDTW